MSGKKKIMRIITRLNIGGPAIHAVLLASGLERERFETVLVSGSIGQGEGDMAYFAGNNGVKPVIIPEMKREIDPLGDIAAFFKILRLMFVERPEVIHTHTAKAGTLGRLAGIVFKVLAFGRGVRIYHTFHGHVFHSYFGSFATRFYIAVERFLASFTTVIIAISRKQGEELVKLGIAPRGRIGVIPLGLDLEMCLGLGIRKGSALDIVTVGIVGRLVPVKNHRMLLNVVKKIRGGSAAWPGIRFRVIGDGPMREELEGYAGELGVEDMVSFEGWLKDPVRIYGGLDIVALTSLNEGTPVAVIEALASGRPCVATDVGGVSDVIENGRSGYLIPSGDEDAFAKALLDLISDAGKRESFGSYGRHSVRSRFSHKRLIRDIEKLYTSEGER